MNVKKILRTAAALLMCAMTLTMVSCSPAVVDIKEKAPKSEYPFTVNGITITEAVDKIAVFDDSLADVVMYLGSASQLKLVARGEDVEHPEVDILPTAGTAEDPDVKKLSDIGVDLVLTDETFDAQTTKELNEAGIKVLVCPPASTRTELTLLYRAVACVMLGGKTGYELGEKRASSLLMAMDDILRIIPEKETPVVAGFVLDADGTFATDLTLTGDLLGYVRTVNLAADESRFTAEELEVAAPSMLFCAAGLKGKLTSSDLFKELSVVKKGNVVELPEGELVWQGEYLLNGLLRMATALYPDLDAEGLLPDINNKEDEDSKEPGNDTTSSRPEGNYPSSVNESSSKEDIRILQDRLIELGYLPPPSNGAYTFWTRACVKEFQKKAKLPQTGVADAKTMAALFAEDAPKF